MQALKVLTVSLGAEHGEALLVVALLLARYQEDAVPAAWQSACIPVAQLPRTRRAESKSGSVASSHCPASSSLLVASRQEAQLASFGACSDAAALPRALARPRGAAAGSAAASAAGARAAAGLSGSAASPPPSAARFLARGIARCPSEYSPAHDTAADLMAPTRNVLISSLMLLLAVGLVFAATASAADLPRRMLPAVAWRNGYSCCWNVCRGSCASLLPARQQYAVLGQPPA